MTTAWLLKSSILKSSETPFILELPQYRMPTLRSLVLRLVDRARIFLRQAGTIILAVTMALWVLAHLPVLHTAAGVCSAPELADSIIGRLGHFIEPAIAPLGFNWKIGIGLLSSRPGPRSHGQHHGHPLRRRPRNPGPAACRPPCTTT